MILEHNVVVTSLVIVAAVELLVLATLDLFGPDAQIKAGLVVEYLALLVSCRVDPASFFLSMSLK